MEKVIRDGMVAILISPKYGAGWYTWNDTSEECLYDPETVAWVEAGKPEGSRPNWEEKFGKGRYFCTLGADTLVVEWLPEGTAFRVEEYDGFESLRTNEGYTWSIA